jgi:predicted phosphodiesterase
MVGMAIKTTVVVPDIQYPYHDKLALQKVLNVIEDVQPDAVLQIGDGIDFPQVSRWSKGTAGEYAPTLQEHIDGYRRDFLVPVREMAPTAVVTWLEGNHDLRVKDFIKQYAAPLGPLRALEMKSLFGLEELAIDYVQGPVRVGTNTYAVHGHESGGYSSQPQAWDLKFIRRYGSDKNVLFGHTHQPYLVTRAYGFAGKVSPRWTMNVGSVMDPTEARYVKDGAVSWQMSFAVLRDDGKKVHPELVTMDNRQFWFEGKRY